MSKQKKQKKPKSLARRIVEWSLTGIVGLLLILVVFAQVGSIASRGSNHGVPDIYGYQTMIVMTDSMEPRYPVDSLIVVKKKSTDEIKELYDYYTLNADKIASEEIAIDLTFYDGDPVNRTEWVPTNAPITHRLESITYNPSAIEGKRYVFTIHGINVNSPHYDKNQKQQYNEKDLMGEVVFSSVFLGGFYNFATSGFGLIVLLLIPSGYLIVTSVLDLTKGLKDDDEDEKKPPVPEGGTPPADGSAAKPALSSLSEEERARLKQEMLNEMLGKKKGDTK